MSTKALKYKELLQLSDKEKESTEIEFQVEQTKLQLQADLLSTKQSLVAKQKEVAVVRGTFPFSTQRVINLQIEVESLEDGVKRIEKLQSELF